MEDVAYIMLNAVIVDELMVAHLRLALIRNISNWAGENLVPEPALQVQASAPGQESAKRRNVLDTRPALGSANPASGRSHAAPQVAGEGRLPDVDHPRFGRGHSR